jgi:hypothetical protein
MNALGPDYPALGAAVAKWRARARDGLKALSREERRAYGAAVERAILALQRSEAGRGSPPINPRCGCASGTPHNTGEAIHKAVREQQARALAAFPAYVRRHRTDAEWRQMYETAMAEKRHATMLAAAASERARESQLAISHPVRPAPLAAAATGLACS